MVELLYMALHDVRIPPLSLPCRRTVQWYQSWKNSCKESVVSFLHAIIAPLGSHMRASLVILIGSYRVYMHEGNNGM